MSNNERHAARREEILEEKTRFITWLNWPTVHHCRLQSYGVWSIHVQLTPWPAMPVQSDVQVRNNNTHQLCGGIPAMSRFNSINLRLRPTEQQQHETRWPDHWRLWWMRYKCIFGNPRPGSNEWRHGHKAWLHGRQSLMNGECPLGSCGHKL